MHYNLKRERENGLTVKITGKWSRKVNIFRACPRHCAFTVSQKPPKSLVLPAPIQLLSHFTPQSLQCQFGIPKPQVSDRSRGKEETPEIESQHKSVKEAFFEGKIWEKEKGVSLISYSRVWRLRLGIDPAASAIRGLCCKVRVWAWVQYSKLNFSLIHYYWNYQLLMKLSTKSNRTFKKSNRKLIRYNSKLV